MSHQFSSRFAAILAGQDGAGTLTNRAELLASQAKTSQQTLIDKIKSQVYELELTKQSLIDFGPESTFSLKTGAGFNPASWATDYHKVSYDLTKKKEELEIAEATFADLFSTPVLSGGEPPVVPPSA